MITRQLLLSCLVVYIFFVGVNARVVDTCRDTNTVYDHSVDMVVDWRDAEGYGDTARFKRDMQGGTNTNPGANNFWLTYKSVKGFSKIFVRIVYYEGGNFSPEEDRSFFIGSTNDNKAPLTTFTETANQPITHGYFYRDYTFTNLPDDSHFFQIKFKPWFNIKGINYWTPQIAHVEYDEKCDPVSTCGNGKCEETCISCPQDCGACPKPVCGNGICDFGESWGGQSCNADCNSIVTCGNWICEGTEVCGASTKYSCSADCCNGTLGFRPGVCGNGKCDGAETCNTCAKDCGACAVCGDNKCSGSETCSSCPGDCGACKNCEGTSTTTSTTGVLLGTSISTSTTSTSSSTSTSSTGVPDMTTTSTTGVLPGTTTSTSTTSTTTSTSTTGVPDITTSSSTTSPATSTTSMTDVTTTSTVPATSISTTGQVPGTTTEVSSTTTSGLSSTTTSAPSTTETTGSSSTGTTETTSISTTGQEPLSTTSAPIPGSTTGQDPNNNEASSAAKLASSFFLILCVCKILM